MFSYVTDDLAEGRMLLQARRAVLPSLEVLGTWLTDDVVRAAHRDGRADRTPASEIAAEVRADDRCRRARRRRQHAPDDRLRRADPDAAGARAAEAFGAILDAGRALGGTVTGEHGIGRIKQDFLAERDRAGGAATCIGRSSGRWIRQDLFNPGSMFAT